MRLLLAATMIFLAEPASAQQRPRIDVPVVFGGDIDIDACSGSGTIVGLDPNGDGFLSVRSGPGGRPFHEMDRVFNGQQVAICETRGPWFAVVYDFGRSTIDCGTNSPVRTRTIYTGPCRFGWVYSRYVGDLAG